MTILKAWYDPEVTDRDVGLSWTPGQFHTQLLYATPPSAWTGLVRGVRVEKNTVVITVNGGNDAARELCGKLINELEKAK
jgi:hypothetical protein